MGKSRAELKLQAKRALSGKYGASVGGMLIVYAVMFAAIMMMELILVGTLVGSAMFSPRENIAGLSIGVIIFLVVFMAVIFFMEYMVMAGFTRLFYNICTAQAYGLKDLLYGFSNGKGKFYAVAGIMMLICGACGTIGFMLSIISWPLYFVFLIIVTVASVVFSLVFGMFYMIMVENPEVGIVDALKTSARIMSGNKWRYFVLLLSFLGWFFLIYITLGIAMLWVLPYVGCTFIEFYLDIKEKPVFDIYGAQNSGEQKVVLEVPEVAVETDPLISGVPVFTDEITEEKKDDSLA